MKRPWFNIDQWFSIAQKNVKIRYIILLMHLIRTLTAFILNFEYDIIFLLSSVTVFFIVGLSILLTLFKIYYNKLNKNLYKIH